VTLAAWLFIGLALGFILGAGSAFILGKKFLRTESRRLYERWRRRERSRRQAWTSLLIHDLKNPLFLIQAFTWTYLDKFKKGESFSAETNRLSSEKMAETLHRQATKVLGLLKEVSKEAPALPAPARELWDHLASKKNIQEILSRVSFETRIPEEMLIHRNWTLLEEGLEELLLTLLEEGQGNGMEVSLEREGTEMARCGIRFTSETPASRALEEAKMNLEVWAETADFVIDKRSRRPIGVTFNLKI